jgi:hypothetical protein
LVQVRVCLPPPQVAGQAPQADQPPLMGAGVGRGVGGLVGGGVGGDVGGGVGLGVGGGMVQLATQLDLFVKAPPALGAHVLLALTQTYGSGAGVGGGVGGTGAGVGGTVP